MLDRRRRTEDRLSFYDLIEAHIVRALRSVHGVSHPVIRRWIDVARSKLEVDRPLLDARLGAFTRQFLSDRQPDHADLAPSRRLALGALLEQHLARIEYDDSGLPTRFFPFARAPRNAGGRLVLITPYVAFGRPILRRTGISTRAVAQRLDAGESLEVVRTDYFLTAAEIDEAVLFEAAA